MSSPFRRSSHARWLIAAIVAFVGLVPARSAGAQRDHQQVLVLYSTRRDAMFSMVGESELPRMLAKGLGSNLDYYSEFIDVATFPDPAYREAFRNFMHVKYRGVQFDLVIVLQDTAMEFFEAHRDELFGGAAAVFLSNDPPPRRLSNSTGLIVKRNFSDTLTLLRQLQPDVTQVFVVTGAAPADRAFEGAVRQQLDASAAGLTFTYLSGLPTRDLEDRLSKLPARSAVYYAIVNEDGAGNKFHPLDYVDRVAAVANAPTYCWVDSAIGRGILGGNLYRQGETLQRVGELALRALRGEPLDTIPVSAINPNGNQIDWRQLRRWGISEARVPAGTIIDFRQRTLWDEYRAYILTGVVLLGMQSVLITGLLLQRRRRRLAEDQFRRSQRALLKSYERNRDLGGRLLLAQESERARIARELHDDICQRMLLLTIELEELGRSGRDNAPAAAEAVSVSRDISRSLHELSHRLHPTRLRLIGLVHALEQLRLELSRAGMAITFTHHNVPAALRPDVMLCLFRVAQESLQNALKYSHANNVSVDLQGGPDRLTLKIVDDGIGFDVDAAWRKGLGLISMAERLEASGGSLTIWSKPGGGTRVTAAVPIEVVQDLEATPVALSDLRI